MYVESRGVVQPATAATGQIDFLTTKGVKQGDGASPELFGLFFDRGYKYIQANMAKNNYTR